MINFGSFKNQISNKGQSLDAIDLIKRVNAVIASNVSTAQDFVENVVDLGAGYIRGMQWRGKFKTSDGRSGSTAVVINMQSGAWFCHGDSAGLSESKGGDFVSLYASKFCSSDKYPQLEAAKNLARLYGIDTSEDFVMPAKTSSYAVKPDIVYEGDDSETVTILYPSVKSWQNRPHPGKTITKRADGSIDIESYDFKNSTVHFDAEVVGVSGILDFHNVCEAVRQKAEGFIVRGHPLQHTIRRTVKKYEGDEGGLIDRKRHWLILDFDKIPVPNDKVNIDEDHMSGIRFLLSLLPDAFSKSTFSYQYSSSQNVKNKNTISAHLRFWLSESKTKNEASSILQSLNDYAKNMYDFMYGVEESLKERFEKSAFIDEALSRPSQPAFIAQPKFVGMQDVLSQRSGFVVGACDAVDCELLRKNLEMPEIHVDEVKYVFMDEQEDKHESVSVELDINDTTGVVWCSSQSVADYIQSTASQLNLIALEINSVDIKSFDDRLHIVCSDLNAANLKSMTDFASMMIQTINPLAIRSITPPEGASSGWSIAHEDDQTVFDILNRATRSKCLYRGSLSMVRPEDVSVTRMTAKAAPQRWLWEGLIPDKALTVVAADGAVGKSYMMLQLALGVASWNGKGVAPTVGGVSINKSGIVVILSAEDNWNDINDRLDSLDPDFSIRQRTENKLLVLPHPDLGGAPSLIQSNKGVMSQTDAFDNIVNMVKQHSQRLGIPVAMIVIDTYSAYVTIDGNSTSETQYAQTRFSSMATDLGCAVVQLHHLSKLVNKGNETLSVEDEIEALRARVKGNGQIVNGARCVLGMMNPSRGQAQAISEAVGKEIYANNIVVIGVLKSNHKNARYDVIKMVRENGVFVAYGEAGIDDYIEKVDNTRKQSLMDAIQVAHDADNSFTKTGKNSLHTRRFELPREFHDMSRRTMESLIDELIVLKNIDVSTTGKLYCVRGGYNTGKVSGIFNEVLG